MSDNHAYEQRCRDCGEAHCTGGDALRCDHRLSRHAATPLLWKASDGTVVGCPACRSQWENRYHMRLPDADKFLRFEGSEV